MACDRWLMSSKNLARLRQCWSLSCIVPETAFGMGSAQVSISELSNCDGGFVQLQGRPREPKHARAEFLGAEPPWQGWEDRARHASQG